MLEEEGLEQAFARHRRFAEATHRAAAGWGLELQCSEISECSPVLTTIRTPEGINADAFRKLVLDRFDLSLGTGSASWRARSSASGTWAISTT